MKRQLQNLKAMLLTLVTLVLVTNTSSAQCVTISGAGISAANGQYTLSSNTNDYGAPYYENASGTHFIGYDGASAWYISDHKSPWYGNDYYEGYGNSTDDPSTLTWSDNWGGATPLPSFSGCYPNDSAVLTVSTDTFCYGNPVDITLEGNLSSGSDWYWYKDSISTSPIDSGTSLTVTPPNENTVYYCRAENSSTSFVGDSSVVSLIVKSTPGKPMISGCGNNSDTIQLTIDSAVNTEYKWGVSVLPDLWETVGSRKFSGGRGYNPRMGIDENGVQYVVFGDGANSNKATVMKYNGTSWTALGGVGFSAGQALNPSIALDTNGVPYVGYRDAANSNKATVMKYNGTSWVNVGSVGFSAGNIDNISITVSDSNVPYVAYRDAANSYKVTAMKFNGTTWTTLGSAGFSSGGPNSLSIVLDGSGVPYVSYSDVSISSKAVVMKYNGTSWTTVGSAGFSAAQALYNSMAFDGNNTPYIAYRDRGNSNKATVMKYNGTSWSTVGSAGFTAGSVSHTSLVTNKNGIPYLAFSDGSLGSKATAVKFNGTTWTTVGSVGFSESYVGNLSLGLSESGVLSVLFTEGTDEKTTVMRFNEGTTSANFQATDTSLVYHLQAIYPNGCIVRAIPIKGSETQPIAIPSIANATYQSNTVYTDGNWNHYCDCDNGYRLLSLDTTGTGAVIPADSVWVKTGAEKTKSWTTSGGLITNTKGGSTIDRKWEVSPTTQPTSDVSVRYYFSEDEYQAIKDTMANHNGGTSGYPTTISSPADLEMFKITSAGKFNDPHTTGVTGGVYANASTSSNTNWAYTPFNTNHCAEIKVSSFSGGAIGSGGGGAALGNAPLPVELIHFTATAADHHTANLTGATATELNNSHFEVQRSYDGASFETIDVVAGNGTINSVMEYSYSDVNIDQNENIVYYRLRQVDYDGASELTEVRKVNFRDDNILESDIVVYPNPTQDKVYISLGANPEEVVNATVIDVNGRTVANYELSQSITQIDISELESGLYFVQFSIDNKNHFVKVTKN